MAALNSQQWIALGIFVLTYGLIISNRVDRTIASILGGVLVAVLVLTPEQILHYENWETLIFVFGMMTVIAAMEHSGFFRWLGLHAAKGVRLDPLKLYILFPIIAAVLAAFVDSITVMLFMTTLTLEVAGLVNIRALPLILAEIAAANIGGASTMVGDPPNVILGTYFHLTFFDFVKNTGPAALLGLVINVFLFYLVNRKEITLRRQDLKQHPEQIEKAMSVLRPNEAVEDRHLFWVGILGFLYVVVMLVTHHITGLSAATVAISGALIVMLLGGPLRTMPHILQKIDYQTIIFFAGLFLIVGGLEQVGLLEMASDAVLKGTGGNLSLVLTAILWFAAIASSVVDNVPMAATMAPMLKHLAATAGFDQGALVWSTALGTDIGGNGTPIGASANVVAVATYEKTTKETVSWGEYCKFSYPIMMVVVLAMNAYLVFFYGR